MRCKHDYDPFHSVQSRADIPRSSTARANSQKDREEGLQNQAREEGETEKQAGLAALHRAHGKFMISQ